VRLRLLPYVDVEGKVARAVAELGNVAGQDVVVLDADGTIRARQLADVGARVVVVAPEASAAALRTDLGDLAASGRVSVATGTPSGSGVAGASADVVVGFWTSFHPGAPDEFAEAARILRPGGRLLAVHDYARDDVSAFFPEERSRDLVAMSRRGGWYLEHGFKIRVVHAFWTFPDSDTMLAVMTEVFGADAAASLSGRRRARLSWKVVVYHRTAGDVDG
jgi:SAM-dependent methyltransferase